MSSTLTSALARVERANQLASAHQLGDLVTWQLRAYSLTAIVLAVTFVEGKVLYTLGVYTGYLEPDFANQYGFINSLGWDEKGQEYIRIPNVDSIFVVPTA